MSSHALDDRPGNQARVTLRVRSPGSLTSARMSWYWRLEDPSGAELVPAAVGVEVPRADNQGDAESWLGEHWRELLARGVAAVTLLEGGTPVYGPMALAPS